MNLREIAQRNEKRHFQDWQTEEKLHFDERGKLVNKDGAFIHVTRDLLLKDFEIICDHPHDSWVIVKDTSYICGIAIRCEKCDKPLKIVQVKAMPMPHANLDLVNYKPQIPERKP